MYLPTKLTTSTSLNTSYIGKYVHIFQLYLIVLYKYIRYLCTNNWGGLYILFIFDLLLES